jgi:glyoxylase-like metal-dependent hydrolase (beta-lactamase superfamily II)
MAVRPLAAAVLALLVAPAVAQTTQPYPPLVTPLVVSQVPGEPIYYTLGSPGVPEQRNEGNTSNAGFVVTTDGVVVFDALGTPSLGWNLFEAIKKATNLPVRYNVVSHYHADHIYGLPSTARTIRLPASAPISGLINAARRSHRGSMPTRAWCRRTSRSTSG